MTLTSVTQTESTYRPPPRGGEGREAASSSGRVAVLGGGIAGLATAHFLAKAGLRPVVFEAADEVGGLGGQLEHRELVFDRFYHVMLETDVDLLGLIEEVGLFDRVAWRSTSMGFYVEGKMYRFDGPLDLLRFSALSMVNRLRVGAGAVYMTRVRRNPDGLDDVTAAAWLRGIFGAEVCERIWKPLLRAKFGDAYETIPALWIWALLNREKDGSPEVKGYLEGGYAALARRLATTIEENGGEMRVACPVRHVEERPDSLAVHSDLGREEYSAVVSTLPLPVLSRIAAPSLAPAVPMPELDYQGVLNAVLLSRRPLDRYYWTVVLEPSFPFQGVVETTHVIPPPWVGGRHLIYLMNYCRPGSPEYDRPDAVVRRQALEGLSALYPTFDRRQIEDIYVFRAPHVEPVWSLGYTRQRPPARTANPRLYISSTAQAYPRVTAWNTSISLARETAAAVLADHPAEATAETRERQ